MLPSISGGASYSRTAITAVTLSPTARMRNTGSGAVRTTLSHLTFLSGGDKAKLHQPFAGYCECIVSTFHMVREQSGTNMIQKMSPYHVLMNVSVTNVVLMTSNYKLNYYYTVRI